LTGSGLLARPPATIAATSRSSPAAPTRLALDDHARRPIAENAQKTALTFFDHFDVDLVSSGSELEQCFRDGLFDGSTFAFNVFAHVA
jgi:hypothetical protein